MQCANIASKCQRIGAEPQELIEWAIKHDKISNARGPGILASWFDGFQKTRALHRIAASAKKHSDVREATHYPVCACGEPIVVLHAQKCGNCEQVGKVLPPDDFKRRLT